MKRRRNCVFAFVVICFGACPGCQFGDEQRTSTPARYVNDQHPWQGHVSGRRSETMPLERVWLTLDKLTNEYNKRGRGWSWQEFVTERREFNTLPSHMMFLGPPDGGEKAYAVMYFGRHDRILPVEVVDLSGRVATVTIPEWARESLMLCWRQIQLEPTPEYASRMAKAHASEIALLMNAIADADWKPASERMPQWLEYVEVDGHQVYKCDGSDCKPQPWVGGDKFDRHPGPK